MTQDISLTLRWSGMTDKGRFRPNNEDSFLALTFDSNEVRYLGKTGEGTLASEDYVFAVSDGMGGAKSGEFASRIATQKITKLLPKSFKQSAQGLSAGFGDVLGELFDAIHKELSSLSRWYEECRDMGATLTLGWFTPEWMFFGHLGDSRLYYLPHNGPLKQLTDDHTFVGYQRRKGQLNEREARNHPRRNILQQALGAGHQFINPHMGAVGFEPGDRFLICSDGLVDGLWDRGLEERLRAPLVEGETLAQRLVLAAINEGSRDNVTALVVEVCSAR
jgi:protein phosphatase